MKILSTNFKIKFITIAVATQIIFANFSLFLLIINNSNQYYDDAKYDSIRSSSSVDDYEYSWDSSWGGIYDDYGVEVATDSQNKIYLVGWTDLTGSDNGDIIISKYDINGQEEWVKTWGGTNNDNGCDIYIDALDNVYIIGCTKSLGDTNGDIVIIKFDTMGNEIWNKTWGGAQYDTGTYIIEDTLGNFYVSGQTSSFGDVDGDALLIKFNNIFEEQWNVTWGGSEHDIANKVEINSNNYLYVVGHSDSLDPSPGESDVFLLKYNSSGDFEWERDWETSYTQRGVGLALDSNNNIYITGYTFGHPASSGKGYLLKYDSSGTYQWERIWGVDGQYGNYFYKIIIDDKDDLYISGCTKTYGIPNNYDPILLNYDTSGNQNWNKIWIGSGFDITAGICMDSFGNIYLAGQTDTDSVGGYDILLIKYENTLASNITIISPENTTYTEPMSGYYPATYGFENDIDGTVPKDWFLGIATGGTAQVVSELGGRKKVLQLVDTVTNGYPYLTQTFTSQTTGIIEFHIRKESGNTQVGVELRSAGIIATGIRIDYGNNGKFEAYQGSSYLEIAAGEYIDQTWFHIKIDFDTSTDTADFYVNGALEASNIAFKQNVESIDRIYFGPNYLYTGIIYADAIGYSWDSDYNIGDNIDEGLLLSFKNSTNLDWKGYSLDGNANKTILGSKAIPMPADGQHRIQVFGNDTLGNTYKSNIRHFTIDISHYIFIDTPENKMYTEPMRGYYPGSFGFENDILNSFPYGWIDNDISTCETRVIGNIDGHNGVVQQYDNHGSAAAQMNKDIPATLNITVEFWVRTDLLVFVYFNVRDTSSTYNTWDLRNLSGFSVDTWHHIRFVINTITDKYDSYIDGAQKNNQANLPNPMNDVDQIQFNTAPSQINYNIWWDAIGGSWDPYYNIGDNLNEGLLLSYTNTTNLNWIGYSLDGNPNTTITGNKVIPFPENGVHSIILNGNTSNGVLIKSELRSFSILLQDPYLPPENPYMILIVYASIGTGIIALLSIALFLFRRRLASRTSSVIISHEKSQLDENIKSGSDQFKFCPLCHAQIKKIDQFCVFCGTSLKND